eukprot:TRINITY_DN11129_c0_g1_i2.p2 TRINITY_DN11129_c0_g1~~TRINITY_DN11129_c0_g1_i2.p2  ORF type:complete len:123 (-),score=24.27 TRINITY_DN11129_c0_g1_i2:98-466(-)
MKVFLLRADVSRVGLECSLPHLLSCALDKTVRVWDLGSNTERHVFEHEAGVVMVRPHPKEPTAVSCALDGSLRALDHRACTVAKVMRGHGDVVHAFAFTENGEGFVSVSDDHTARVFSLVDA